MSAQPASGAAPITLADLRRVDLFEGLDDAGLQRWVDVAVATEAQPGELIADQDQRPPGLHLLLEGTVRSLIVDGERTEPVGRQEAPTWMGAIALLTEGTAAVRMQADTACRLAFVAPADFLELVFQQRPVHQRIMRQIAPVVRRVTAIGQNRERLESLGTMAAGLAHELNNPAAAARRAASDMAEALDVLSTTIAHFVESGVERTEAEQLVALQREALERARTRTALDALDAADAEDELLEQLEALGVEEPWRHAEPLASAGVDREWLHRVSVLAGPATHAAIAWVSATLTARSLASELSGAAEQMSRLVGAVKTYAYMDRGALVEVDVHEGLETTLIVLGHKLKHTDIEIVRHYERELPRLSVRGSELNQVWTNILDNAIDALGTQGTITITTARDGDCAQIEISDNGPGIAPEALDRVFDPFFTTKGVGQGTGLGLDTARRIVVDRHDGSLSVASRPGATTFTVRLPLRGAPSEGPGTPTDL